MVDTRAGLWRPPPSPEPLFQELLWPHPWYEWRVLVACLFFNRTRRSVAGPVLWKIFARWPDPWRALRSLERPDAANEMRQLIAPLGLGAQRTDRLLRLTEAYVADTWETPLDLPGCGPYADAAWRIFVLGVWRDVCTDDHALLRYLEHLRVT